MIVLDCCNLNIIHYDGIFKPNSIMFTLFYYLRGKKHCRPPPAVYAAQNERLFTSSANQQWRLRQEDGGIARKI